MLPEARNVFRLSVRPSPAILFSIFRPYFSFFSITLMSLSFAVVSAGFQSLRTGRFFLSLPYTRRYMSETHSCSLNSMAEQSRVLLIRIVTIYIEGAADIYSPSLLLYISAELLTIYSNMLSCRLNAQNNFQNTVFSLWPKYSVSACHSLIIRFS